MGAGEGVPAVVRVELGNGGRGAGRDVAMIMRLRTEIDRVVGDVEMVRVETAMNGVGHIVRGGSRGKGRKVSDTTTKTGGAIDYVLQTLLDTLGDISRPRKKEMNHLTANVATTFLHIDDATVTLTMKEDIVMMTRMLTVPINAPAGRHHHRARLHGLELFLMAWTMFVHPRRHLEPAEAQVHVAQLAPKIKRQTFADA